MYNSAATYCTNCACTCCKVGRALAGRFTVTLMPSQKASRSHASTWRMARRLSRARFPTVLSAQVPVILSVQLVSALVAHAPTGQGFCALESVTCNMTSDRSTVLTETRGAGAGGSQQVLSSPKLDTSQATQSAKNQANGPTCLYSATCLSGALSFLLIRWDRSRIHVPLRSY